MRYEQGGLFLFVRRRALSLPKVPEALESTPSLASRVYRGGEAHEVRPLVSRSLVTFRVRQHELAIACVHDSGSRDYEPLSFCSLTVVRPQHIASEFWACPP